MLLLLSAEQHDILAPVSIEPTEGFGKLCTIFGIGA